MRTLAAIIVLLVAVHLLAATGGMVWLAATDRLSRERFESVADVFRVSVAQELRDREEQQRRNEEALKVQAQLVHLEEVADGPQRIEDRLAGKLEGDDLAVHRLERMRQEAQAIQRRLDQDRRYVDEKLAELAGQRQRFEEEVARRQRQLNDEDFKRAVSTLEQLPPRQGKAFVQQLLTAGQMQQAVDYLAEMQLRKSAGILKEFKGEDDAPQASALLEALRTRGETEPPPGTEAAATPPAGGAGAPAS